MPPHCDLLDGPVVTTARKALEAQNVNLALAYVPENGSAEIRSAFEKGLAKVTRPLAKWPSIFL